MDANDFVCNEQTWQNVQDVKDVLFSLYHVLRKQGVYNRNVYHELSVRLRDAYSTLTASFGLGVLITIREQMDMIYSQI